ncbi:hypothetical protein N2152v2_007547 [Parachlorella kessleri]
MEQQQGLLDLSSDLLLHLLEKAAQGDRATRISLAQTCQRFAALLEDSRQLWGTARLLVADYLEPLASEGVLGGTLWYLHELRWRSHLVWCLVIEYKYAVTAEEAGILRALLPHLVAAIPCLEELRLWRAPEAVYLDSVLLACPTTLLRLCITGGDQMRLPQATSRLKSLTRLRFNVLSWASGSLCAESLAALEHLTALRTLRLAALAQLPSQLLSLTELTELQLSTSTLAGEAVLLQGLSALRKLQRLRFVDCTLPVVPSSFSQLAALTHLSLIRCSLHDTPASYQALATLTALPHLQVFTLEGCQAEDAAQHIRQLQHLTRLSLSGNRLRQLPPGPYLGNLTALRLSGGAMTDPAGLAGLASCSRLVRLGLHSFVGGRFPTLLLQPLVALRGLTALALCGVGLQDLPPGRYLQNLRDLDLSSNAVRLPGLCLQALVT